MVWNNKIDGCEDSATDSFLSWCVVRVNFPTIGFINMFLCLLFVIMIIMSGTTVLFTHNSEILLWIILLIIKCSLSYLFTNYYILVMNYV